MRIVRPVSIVESNLDAINVPIDDAPPWAADTVYQTGDPVIWNLVVYEYLSTGNAGPNPPDTPTATAPKWFAVAPVNAWRAFNKRIGNRWLPDLYASNPDVIDFTVSPGGIVNSVGLTGVYAQEVQIIMTAPGGEEVYNKTYSLAEREPVTNWYEHWFNNFTRRSSVTDFDLPAYGNATIRVIARSEGETVRIGTFVVGAMRKIGDTLIGSGFNFRSRSTFSEDPVFGGVEIVSRGSGRENDFRVSVDRGSTDAAVNLLEEIRDTPTLFVGDSSLDSMTLFGWMKDSPGVVDSIAKTLLNIKVWRL